MICIAARRASRIGKIVYRILSLKSKMEKPQLTLKKALAESWFRSLGLQAQTGSLLQTLRSLNKRSVVCSCPTRRIRNLQRKCLLRDLNTRIEIHVAL